MFQKVLIANRGEIAVRIIRALRDMDIQSVAVFSKADEEALHVQLADEAICIGPADARSSYLSMPNILSATVLTNADAIHPGYGLLSENAKFARMCAQCNIAFIGPSPDAMERMGDKLNARMTMIASDVPVIPGSIGPVSDLSIAKADARRAGYPVLVKAAAGGGGRGIRVVQEESELEGAMEAAQAEAVASFGDSNVYIEKLITGARHIEIQLLCDGENDCYLFERDCSLQMRRQKLIEESPSPFVDEALREEMGKAALRAAKAVDYRGAGTVEFLVDKDRNFYFMEMNTRLQVEHPVTEMVTGVDIVREQLLVASGQGLSIRQEDLAIHGHAIECRINANDPARGFAPSCGRVEVVHIPGGPGVRFDSMLYNGCMVSPHYDSMVAKLICHGPDRLTALSRSRRALHELILGGVEHNTDFQLDLISTHAFISGDFHTQTVEQMIEG